MIVTSFAEVVSIGAVLPFLGALTSPEKIFAHELAQPLIKLLQIPSARELLLPVTLIFIFFVILAALARITLLWFQTRLSMAIGTDLSLQAYERTLYQPYHVHASRNSSEILAGVRKAEGLVYSLIQPLLVIVSSTTILGALIAALLVIQPFVALTAFLGLGFIYVGIVSMTKRRIATNSYEISIQQGRVNKAIQEGLGGIRDVLIDGTQSIYSELYKESFTPMRAAQASNQVVGATPRFAVEALGMAVIATLAYFLTDSGESGGVNNAIPVLGALTIGAQRILPLLQQIYTSYIVVKGNQASSQDALVMLGQPMPEYAYSGSVAPMSFQTALTIKDLSFRYAHDKPWVLRNLTLRIPKGTRVGFIGITGSGKSTLLDILMGLLTPTDGEVLVDNNSITQFNSRSWQVHISHVPQAIFLADTSIAENIAFSVPPDLIDLQRVKHAAGQAQIANTIEGWPDGYDTLVGERGVRLSGGQRQRIGIARALYKRANVIIFDEATSALDSETEAAVMESIDTLGRDITVMIIAHRITTLKKCDFIVKLADGGIKEVGDYDQMTRSASIAKSKKGTE